MRGSIPSGCHLEHSGSPAKHQGLFGSFWPVSEPLMSGSFVSKTACTRDARRVTHLHSSPQNIPESIVFLTMPRVVRWMEKHVSPNFRQYLYFLPTHAPQHLSLCDRVRGGARGGNFRGYTMYAQVQRSIQGLLGDPELSGPRPLCQVDDIVFNSASRITTLRFSNSK